MDYLVDIDALGAGAGARARARGAPLEFAARLESRSTDQGLVIASPTFLLT